MAENQQKTTEDTLSTEDIAVEDPPESTEKTKEEATSEDQIDPIPIEPETESPSPDSATEATVQEEPQPVVASEDPESQPDDSEPESDQDEDEKSVIAPVQGMIGYTGQILGDVIKLEDLDTGIEPELYKLGSDELREMIETTLVHVAEHEIVKGKIVSIAEKDVIIDIGFKSDGIVSRNEFDEEISEGDEVEVFLERIEDYHGQLVLSKTKADTLRRWNRVEEAYENEEIIEGVIVRRIKGGMIVELFEGMEAFLPGSQIDVRPVRDFDAYLEKRMEFKIVKLNPVNENIVVSHKALIEKDLQEQRESILSAMEPGQILEGAVKNITDFGVFIDLGGVDGLLHITDLSWGRVSHPSELVSLDEKLNVVVLDYDRERQRISLGLKQLQPHPWDEITVKFSPDDTVEGKVVSITDYGAFIELEKGIEGLVHISEMSWTEHIRHPSQMVSLGQIVSVKILNIDTEGKKISLGMKQLEPDPWENIAERYPPGTVMKGTIRNITNFGVFVEIEPGIDGLVHISDLSWTKRVRHPGEMVKKGEELDVVVLNIDTSDRRISLGHKQVDTNPWSQFEELYAEGETTTATVTRIEERGLVVELPLDVEAFMPTKELNHPSNVDESYLIGQTLENLIVIRFNASQKEIVVSEKATERSAEQAEKRVVKIEEKREKTQEKKETSQYKRKEAAASGSATLGELSGLADLKAKMEAEEVEVPAEVESASKVTTASTENAEVANEVEAATEAEVDTEAVTEAESAPELEVESAPELEIESAPELEVESAPELEVEEKSKSRGRKKNKEEMAEESEDAETEPSDEEEKPKRATRTKKSTTAKKTVAKKSTAKKATSTAKSKTAAKKETKSKAKAKKDSDSDASE
ncbi:MAG: 30S ribosomal protein S1 [Bacteroidetes bacterium]|nr:30S ribosomal protein S1 [Bacteroidota bacterium]